MPAKPAGPNDNPLLCATLRGRLPTPALSQVRWEAARPRYSSSSLSSFFCAPLVEITFVN
eukprot:2213265-Pyramimonas_sp.AAC.1